MISPDKVTTQHLKRSAYLYVRQSTPRQVLENGESTKRQYALQERARALGWTADQIVVVDNDLGQSGASAVDREGFQRLVSEVGLGRVGLVLGLEVSRLARNNTDWHRLLEICAVTDTLILDEDGLYDPRHINDRLLLGLKGAMSEAELHVLRSRLRGGVLNKARRGELHMRLPVGFVYDEQGAVVLDPDKQVQESVHSLFRTFRETGSVGATVRAFRQRRLLFPRCCHIGVRKGEVTWAPLSTAKAAAVLRNPCYAGAYAYGRRQRRRSNGRVVSTPTPVDGWHALIPGAHPAYISWDDYEENLSRLRQNNVNSGSGEKPAREGSALLQSLIICGVCGRRMRVRYLNGGVPYYMCKGELEVGGSTCQSVRGTEVDGAIGSLLVEAISPLALEAALAVQSEVEARLEAVDGLRRKQVERFRYEAEIARRRFMQVDPDHRLVADTLEAEWNSKLCALREAEREYESQRQKDRLLLTDDQRQSILRLASDFPAVWQHPKTPNRERKRMVRLLVEDVTLTLGAEIVLQVRLKGGVTQTVTTARALKSCEKQRMSPDVVRLIDEMAADHECDEIAAKLNVLGHRSGGTKEYTAGIVRGVMKRYRLKSHFTRLRERGLLTTDEIARRLGLSRTGVLHRLHKGRLRAVRYNSRGNLLFELLPSADQGPPGS